MKNKRKIQRILRKLIRTRFYFDLTVPERLELIKEILLRLSVSQRSPLSYQAKDLYLGRERAR